MKDNKILIRSKKPSKKRPCKPKVDAFTSICRAEYDLECVKELQFHPERKWRFDYAFPAHKVALEVEGGVYTQGRHTRPLGFLGDMEKYNSATVLGWRILRTTPAELYSNKTLKLVCEACSLAKK